MVFFFFDVYIIGSDVTSEVDISSFGVFNILSEVIAVLGNSVNILSKSNALNVLLTIEIFDSSDFVFGILEDN